MVAGGFVLAAAGCLAIALWESHGLPVIVAGSVILAIGLAPVVILATDLVVGAAPPERAGSASALSETSAELGGALGIALLGCVISAVYRGNLPPGTVAVARNSLAEALAVAETLPAQASQLLIESAREAFTRGVRLSAGLAALLSIVAAVIAARLLRPARESSPVPAA